MSYRLRVESPAHDLFTKSKCQYSNNGAASASVLQRRETASCNNLPHRVHARLLISLTVGYKWPQRRSNTSKVLQRTGHPACFSACLVKPTSYYGRRYLSCIHAACWGENWNVSICTLTPLCVHRHSDYMTILARKALMADWMNRHQMRNSLCKKKKKTHSVGLVHRTAPRALCGSIRHLW